MLTRPFRTRTALQLVEPLFAGARAGFRLPGPCPGVQQAIPSLIVAVVMATVITIDTRLTWGLGRSSLQHRLFEMTKGISLQRRTYTLDRPSMLKLWRPWRLREAWSWLRILESSTSWCSLIVGRW